MSPEELARDALRGSTSPRHDLLAAGDRGRRGKSEEATCHSLPTHEPDNPEEKRNCSFFENVGTERTEKK